MNSTFSDNLTGPILCPLDGRRTSKELYVKLAVVHFTTLTAFYYFLSISKDPLLSFWPIIFALAPFNILIQYGTALLSMALGSLVSFESGSYIPSITVQPPKTPSLAVRHAIEGRRA
jgi:hypothetical protein